MWTLEQITVLVTSTCPTQPPNWSIVQELTKLSCVNSSHLKQTLISLTRIGEMWQSNIVIVMTLQQHFARFVPLCFVGSFSLENLNNCINHFYDLF